MFRYILFDLDGTLTDPKEGITRSVQYALRHFGIDEPDLDNLTRFIGPPLVDAFCEFYGFTRAQGEEALQKYRERFADVGIFENMPYEGIHRLLERLNAAGCRLALATSKPEVYACRILAKFDLAKYFTVAVGSTLEGARNAKADVIREVFRRLELDEAGQRQCIMVGDRKHDIEGAAACGIPCCAVRFGYAAPGELEAAAPWAIAEDMAMLESLLLKGGDGV